MRIPVKTAGGGYEIVLERGALSRAGELFNLKRRVFIVTDSGVPQQYAQAVAAQCAEPTLVTIEQGEPSKTAETLLYLLGEMVKAELTRSDCVVAVGGGVVGDLSGFAAACYMRGIDFYNIPTTVLSQVDSSIGGKTAVDFGGYKNIIGAFWQPKAVLIDVNTLATLPPRQIANGLAESVKMALTSDPVLFEIFEKNEWETQIETVIERSLRIKKAVVEEDEREAGLRKILNFGHTLAHAIESANQMENLYHGECVAAGMPPMCAPAVRARLLPVLEQLNLPTGFSVVADKLIEAVKHDKKLSGNTLTVVRVPEVGQYALCDITVEQLEQDLKEAGAI